MTVSDYKIITNPLPEWVCDMNVYIYLYLFVHISISFLFHKDTFWTRVKSNPMKKRHLSLDWLPLEGSHHITTQIINNTIESNNDLLFSLFFHFYWFTAFYTIYKRGSTTHHKRYSLMCNYLMRSKKGTFCASFKA